VRNLALATALVFLAAGRIAGAADLPVKAPVLNAAPVPYSWTGCFVGAAAGGGFGRTEHISGTAPTIGQSITNPFDVSGGVAGLTYGCNWQTGSWVLGTEGDFSWTDVRGSVNNTQPFIRSVISSTNEHWLSTTRLRVGYLPSGQLLVYATGGLATASVEAVADATATGAGIISETRTRWGWTAGGGLEYALGGGWSAKADYLYVRLSSQGYFNPPPAGFNSRLDVPFDEHIVRLGVNYKFTDCVLFVFCGGPVVAKY